MIRFFLLVAVLACCTYPCFSAFGREDEKELLDFLARKKIVGSVDFTARSASLTPSAKAKLRELATRLEATGDNGYLRIEGWAAQGEPPARDAGLALDRAKAVVRYLQEELHVGRSVYFTGMTDKTGGQGNVHRADLAWYEKPASGEERELISNFFD